ncbi:hypothetical protein AWW67_14690 [Roseivirga seohaensis]|uniref:DUF4221 domain-containing protein n=1 Tax=Roseivirga seohaensis TaxID=1914963 RepID=A0A150Y3V4_9BACT|nr:DUF4221 family protein [Roseivirga seohaensis]KYG85618.1 hypothetical protein AWW67_14690 [Roseivirga seohaensis]
MKNVLLFLLISVLLFSSCSKDARVEFEDEIKEPQLVRDSISDFVIELDNFTPLNLRAIRYLDDGIDEFLFFLNPNNNSIYKYWLNDGNRFEKIAFDIIGPRGVGELSGFDVHGSDTLLLLARYAYKLTLASQLQNDLPKLQTFRLLGDAKSIDMTPYATTEAPMVIEDSILSIHSVPFFERDRLSYFEAGNSLVRLSLKDSTFNTSNIYSIQYKKRWSHPYASPSSTYNSLLKQRVITLPADKDLYTLDLNGQIRSTSSSPKSIRDIESYNGDFKDSKKSQLHANLNPSYISILYDKYRDVYYRIVKVPNYKAIELGDKSKYPAMPNVVLVYDANLKLISETPLPSSFNVRMSFVGRSGLYFAQPVIKNRRIDENHLRYVCFKLEDK